MTPVKQEGTHLGRHLLLPTTVVLYYDQYEYTLGYRLAEVEFLIGAMRF